VGAEYVKKKSYCTVIIDSFTIIWNCYGSAKQCCKLAAKNAGKTTKISGTSAKDAGKISGKTGKTSGASANKTGIQAKNTGAKTAVQTGNAKYQKQVHSTIIPC